MTPDADLPVARLRAALTVADTMESGLRKIARADIERDHPTLRSRTARCLLYGHQNQNEVDQLDPLSKSERKQFAGDGKHLPSLAHLMYGWIEELQEHLAPFLDHSEGRNSIPQSVRRKVQARDRSCRLCDRQLDADRAPDSTEARSREYVHDHIIPSYHGGPGDLWNIWLLCEPCNRCKNRHLNIPPKGIRLAVAWLGDDLGIDVRT